MLNKSNQDQECQEKLAVRNKELLTVLFVAAAGGFVFLAYHFRALWWANLFSEIAAGLTVLGLGHIWASHLVEHHASKRLNESLESVFQQVGTTFASLSALRRAGVRDVYYIKGVKGDHDEENRLNRRLEEELARTHDDVRILGVAAKKYLHPGEMGHGLLKAHLLRLQENPAQDPEKKQVKLKVLLLHPLSEQAVSRALRESDYYKDSPESSTASEKTPYTSKEYRRTNLYTEVAASCTTLVGWWKHYQVSAVESADPGSSPKKIPLVEAKLYKAFPACFLLFVNDVVFVEQYHFGSGGRASGKVPILEIGRGDVYQEFEGHFVHVWETAREELKQVFPPCLEDDAEWNQLVKCLKFLRRDLNLAEEPSGEAKTPPRVSEAVPAEN